MEKGTRLVYNSARSLLARYTRLNAASIKYFHTPSMAVSTYRSVSQAKPLVGSKYASYLWKRSFATGKDLRFATEARNLMLKGVDSLADAVEVTLGPKGRNVIIEQSFGAPKITKDGVTVAKNIEFKDRHMNLGAQLVRSVANATNDIAGDGTTTATVLARAIYAEGIKAVAAGMNPMDVRRGIDQAVKAVTEKLRSMSRKINSKEEIQQVATISANGDEEIGSLIAKAMEAVGREGTITVSDGKTVENELEVVEGLKFDRGYISPYFVTDAKTQKCEFENPLILCVEKKISSVNAMLPLLENVIRSQRPLVIIAEDVESEALATLVVNKLRGGIKVCAVKAPGFGENRKANLQDICVLTGGQLVSDDLDVKLENVDMSMLGQAKKVSISKDDTIILDGQGDKRMIQERCDMLRDMIEKSTSEYEKEKLQERLAKLSGGVAVLKVGGSSEVEVNEKKDRINDALNATRAAVEEGIVPGGGSALLFASRDALKDIQGKNFDQNVGIDIVRKALRRPTLAIAKNAGVEGSVVVERLLQSKEMIGYDAAKDQYCDLVQAGIIDPTKVVRTALERAASVAGLMTTTECMVVELPKEEENSHGAAGAGGMGGMDMY